MKLRGLRTRFSIVSTLFLGLFLAMAMVVPEVSAYTGSHDETFLDYSYIDESVSNVTGVGQGAVTLPKRSFEFQGKSYYEGNSGDDIIVAGDLAYVSAGNEFYVFNISDVSYPVHLSSTPIPTTRYHSEMAIAGDLVFIPSYTGFNILNVSNPLAPSLVGGYTSGGNCGQVIVRNNISFSTDDLSGLYILNVTDPEHIVSIANYTYEVEHAKRLAIQGNMLYLGELYAFQIIDISDIHNPTQISRILMQSTDEWDLAVEGNVLAYHYGEGVGSGISLFDISTPTHPVIICNTTLYWHCFDIISGKLFTVQIGNLDIVDISSPVHPIYLCHEYTADTSDFAVSGDYFYTTGINLVQIYRYRNTTEYWNQYKSLGVVQSDPVFTSTGDDLIVDATLQVDAVLPASTSVKYYLSARNGSYWDEVVPGVKFGFAVRGTQLKWMAELSSTDIDASPTIYSINVTCTAHITMIDLTTPSSYAALNDSTPLFSWEPSTDTNQYLLQIDTTLNFNSGSLVNKTVDASEYQLTEPLADGQWYWQVAGIDSQGQIGEFSPARAFTISTGTGTGTGTNTTGNPPDMLLLALAGIAVVSVVVVVIAVRARKR